MPADPPADPGPLGDVDRGHALRRVLEPAGRYPGYRGDALAVYSGTSAICTSSPSGPTTSRRARHPRPLTHTWSLAIEEQFYLVWPPIVIAIMWCARRRRGLGLAVVLAVSVLGALASAAWMAHLYRAGANVTRIYYGTDTHVESILVGCALAAILTMIKERRGIGALVPLAESRPTQPALGRRGHSGRARALLAMDPAVLFNVFTFQGGFFVGALLTAVILASVACAPNGGLARGSAVRPLTYLGTISYGMYLWYFPIFASHRRQPHRDRRPPPLCTAGRGRHRPRERVVLLDRATGARRHRTALRRA